MATVAKKSSKKVSALGVGDWVEVLKNLDGGHPKGVRGVVVSVNKMEDSKMDEMYIAAVDKNGDTLSTYFNRRSTVKKIPAPTHVVTWAFEDSDPFTYAWSRAEADKLAARKRVNGDKVVWSKVFKAV